MKVIYSLFFILLASQLWSQSNLNDSLLFKLKGTVRDGESKAVLGNAKVRIIGSNGFEKTLITDSLGYFENMLPPNTTFSITIFHPDYLNSKGREHTLNYDESKLFIHEYDLNPLVMYGCFIIGLDLDSTFSLKPINLNDDTIILFRKNETVKAELISDRLFKVQDNKYELLNNKNEFQELSIELIDTSMVKISTHGNHQDYWIGNRTTPLKEWSELIKIKN